MQASDDWPPANMETNDSLPVVLYRFRTYGAQGRDGSDKNAVHEILQGRIRFARLRDFNDPFEGRPTAVPAFADVGKQRAAMMRYLVLLSRTRGASPGEARRQAEDFMRGKSQAEIVEWMREKFWETYESEGLFICCLAGVSALRGPLSWSHYADHHRGIAIHFDTRRPPFRFAFRVRYSDTYPEVVVPRTHQDPWEQFRIALMTKSSQWHYEDEYRAMRVDWPGNERRPEVAQLFVTWDGQTALVDRRIVVGVTLGARIPDPQREELLAMIRSSRPDLEIWQARLHNSSYELITERIA